MRRDYKAIIIIALIVSTVVGLSNLVQIFQEDEYYSPLISTIPEEQGINSSVLSNMYDYIEKNNIDIHSVMILRNGFIVNETYLEDSMIRDEQKFQSGPFWLIKNDLHNIYSATKSITSLLIGIAIDHGYINNVNQTLLDFFPDLLYPSNSKSQITIEHLLTMTSGIPDEIDYYKNTVKNILNLTLLDEPGENFYYSSSACHLLTAIIDRSTEMKVEEFAEEFLFKPIGISHDNWIWESDSNGINIGGWGIYMTPRAMARIGLLCINNGIWNETQVISANWIEKSTTCNNKETFYGYLWWIKPNYYYASGMFGQRIYIFPEERIIVVFTGDLLETGGIYSYLLSNFILKAIIQ